MSLFASVRNLVQSPTEIKVRQATDDNDTIGATGTLMNEISILTYSPKTLKEIVQVIKKRLHNFIGFHDNKKLTHKNCIMVLKTVTLISYLLNNGSNQFVEWLKNNQTVFKTLQLFYKDDQDANLCDQIRNISTDIYGLLQDDDLLENRRTDVIQFRSSISSPGRKSTDNSHLKQNDPSLKSNISHSFELNRRISSSTRPYVPSRFSLDPLTEEDLTIEHQSIDSAVKITSRSTRTALRSRFHSNNPFN